MFICRGGLSRLRRLLSRGPVCARLSYRLFRRHRLHTSCENNSLGGIDEQTKSKGAYTSNSSSRTSKPSWTSRTRKKMRTKGCFVSHGLILCVEYFRWFHVALHRKSVR